MKLKILLATIVFGFIFGFLVHKNTLAIGENYLDEDEIATNLTIDINYENGSPVPDSDVVVMQCSTTTGPCASWKKVASYGTTDDGTYSASVGLNKRYLIAVTKDNHECVTPSSCTREFLLTAPVTKTFTLRALTIPSGQICPARPITKAVPDYEDINYPIKVVEKGIEGVDSTAPFNTITYKYDWMKYWLKRYSGYFHGWYINDDVPPVSYRNIRGNIFKVDQVEEPAVEPYLTTVYSIAQNNPGSWWIIGEEPNYLGNSPANKRMAPADYATYYNTFSQKILSADPTAKFVFIYLAQQDNGGGGQFSNPQQYLEDVYTAWKTHTNWCPEPPIDVIHQNYFPYVQDSGSGSIIQDQANTSYLINYVKKWRDFLYTGQAGAAFINEKLSFGTSQSYQPGAVGWNGEIYPSQIQANRYWQAAFGELSNSSSYPYLKFLMNYTGREWSGGNGMAICDSDTYTVRPPDASDVFAHATCGPETSYGKVFTNILVGNSGFELGGTAGNSKFSQWTQSGGTGTHYTLNGADYNFPGGSQPTQLNVESQWSVKFLDSTTSCDGSTLCKLTTRKNYLPVLSDSPYQIGVDYKVLNGTAQITLSWNWYAASNGSIIGSGSCTSPTLNTGLGWQHYYCSVSTPPTTAKFVDASIRVRPMTYDSGGSDVRLDNLTLVGLPTAPGQPAPQPDTPGQ